MGWKDKLPGKLGDIGGKIAGGVVGGITHAKENIEEAAKEKAKDMAMQKAIEKLPADKVSLSNPSTKTLVDQALTALGFENNDKNLLGNLNAALGLKGDKELTDISKFGPKELGALYGVLREKNLADEFREKFAGSIKTTVPGFEIPDGKGMLGGLFGDKNGKEEHDKLKKAAEVGADIGGVDAKKALDVGADVGSVSLPSPGGGRRH